MRNLTSVYLLLTLLLTSCGSVTAGSKLAKFTGISKWTSKFGALKKLGFGTGVLIVSKADSPVQFMASQGMEGLEALCLTQEFLNWVDNPREGKRDVPPDVLEAMQAVIPGESVAPRQFDNGFWALCSTFDGQRYVVVHRGGQTSTLVPAKPSPGLGTQSFIWLGYLSGLALAGWVVLAVVVYFRKGSLGPLAPSRLAKAYLAAITPKPYSERTTAILGVAGCLFFMGITVYHHLWVRQVVASPIVRTAAELNRVDWKGRQVVRLDCKPGPSIRKIDGEEYQLRQLGDLAVVAHFEDDSLAGDQRVVGYAKPLPPGLLASLRIRRKATPVGMIECSYVNEWTGALWWAVMWFVGSFCGLLYFGGRLRKREP